jgi:DNA-binding MarR family transcriptional regulator
MTESAHTVMNALRRIVQGLRESAAYSEKTTGLTAAQLLVLKQVAGNDGMSVNALATATFTHQSTVSEVVTRLELKGFVTRERAADDARRVAIHLTPNGRAVLAVNPSSASDRLMTAVKSLPPETLDSLAAGLDALIRNAGLADEPAILFFEDKPPELPQK